MSYQIGTPANYVDGDRKIAIYDLTNSVFVPVLEGESILGVIGPAKHSARFQTSSTATTQYAIYVYQATANTGYGFLNFDTVLVGPQLVSRGSVITDWVAYTPTFTNFGTVSGVNFISRRVGSSLEVIGTFQAGTTAAATANMTLGFNGTSGNVTSNLAVAQVVGKGSGQFSSTTNFSGITVLGLPGTNYVDFGIESSTTVGYGGLFGSSFGNGGTYSFNFSVPILGWSSNTVMSSDVSGQPVVFKGIVNSGSQVIGSYSTDIALTALRDTAGCWNGTQFLVKSPGDYLISGNVILSASGGALAFINGAALYNDYFSTTTSAGQASSGSITLPNLKAGDTISIRNAAGTVSGASIGIQKINSGSQQIAATESVNARYFASSTTVSGSLATIVWSTKDFDSHGMMSGGIYTVPATGKYQVNAGVRIGATFTSGQNINLQIQRNGTAVSDGLFVISGSIGSQSVMLNDILNCVAGDTIRIQVSASGTSPSIVASNTENFVSIYRVGN